VISVYFPSCGQSVDLTEPLNEDAVITPGIAALLHGALLARLRSRAAWRLEKQRLAADGIADWAIAEWNTMTFADDDFDADFGDSSIDDEAFAIAKELIIVSLAKEGLSPPRNIDEHAKALATESEEIRAKAKARVEAKRAVALAAVTDAK